MNAQTLGELCLEGAGKYKSRKALELCRGDRLLETVNFKTLAFRARQLALLFRSLGLGRGSRIMLLAENRPEWPAALFGAALAGAASLPLSPRAGSRGAGEAGEGVSAVCVTERTAELAAALDSGLPRIYLDSPEGQPAWTGITVSIGGVKKRLPLSPRPELPAGAPEAGETALAWPGGRQSSHRELLSLAARGPCPRLFPRDRLLPLCPLAEKSALILVLAAVRGGASLSCVEGAEGDTVKLLRAAELLRPTVLAGGGDFLENLVERNIRPENFLFKNPLTRTPALILAGRKLMKSLGGNVRFYGVTGPAPDGKTEAALKRVHLPRAPLGPPGPPGHGTVPGLKADEPLP
jgi:long-chain acyl-CoA synthetase